MKDEEEHREWKVNCPLPAAACLLWSGNCVLLQSASIRVHPRFHPRHIFAAESPTPGGRGFLPAWVLKLWMYAIHIIDRPWL